MSCSRTQHGDPSGARTPEDFCEALSSENLLVSYLFQYLNRIVQIVQLEECRTLDTSSRVRSSPGARCCILEQYTSSPLLSTGSHFSSASLKNVRFFRIEI